MLLFLFEYDTAQDRRFLQEVGDLRGCLKSPLVGIKSFRSPLTHASRSTWGDPKTALAPLKKGGI